MGSYTNSALIDFNNSEDFKEILELFKKHMQITVRDPKSDLDGIRQLGNGIVSIEGTLNVKEFVRELELEYADKFNEDWEVFLTIYEKELVIGMTFGSSEKPYDFYYLLEKIYTAGVEASWVDYIDEVCGRYEEMEEQEVINKLDNPKEYYVFLVNHGFETLDSLEKWYDGSLETYEDLEFLFGGDDDV